MRSIGRLLMAALLFAGVAVAQPPNQNQERQALVRPAPIGVDGIVERIMAFDKNKDGKVTKDELPERMHHLIALGDTNKDGALDRDEIRKLATAPATAPGWFGIGGFNTRGRDRVVLPGPGHGPGAIEGIVDDLKLSGKKKEQAMAAVKAHQENIRNPMDQARAQLLQKMKEILSEEELQDFQAALDRPRGGTTIIKLHDRNHLER